MNPSIIQQRMLSVWKIYHSFDESTQHLFWTSWNVALGALQKARYRWQVVHGPLQALQAYLLDYDFDLSNGKSWKRTGYGGIPDCVLSLEESWPLIQHKLQEEFRWQRLLRLTRHEGCRDLERQLDWQVSHVIQKYTDDRLGPALRALHQGTLHGLSGTCPLCGVELTFKHVLWECQFWTGKAKELPEQWKQRLAAGTEPELWQRGTAQSIFYIQKGGVGTFVTEGLWTPQEVRPLLFGKQEVDSNDTRRAFQQDADRLAKRFAHESRNEEILDLQKHIDEDVAGARMRILLEDRSHFLHQSQKGHMDHRWCNKRRPSWNSCWRFPLKEGTSGRSTGPEFDVSKSLMGELRPALTSQCEQATPQTRPKQTRFEIIGDLISAQEGVQPGVHHLRLDKAYLRCTECKSYILARCREDAFNTFVGSPCHVGLLTDSQWSGHPSHTVMRQGSNLSCLRCHGRCKISEQSIELTEKLRKPCQQGGSQDPRRWFN